MNGDSKSLFLTKSFIGLVVAIAAQLLSRYGYHMPDDTTGLVNDIATLLGVAISIWGRITATQPVHILSPKSNQGGFASVPMLLALIVLTFATLVVGCATGKQRVDLEQDPERAVFAAQSSYLVALDVALAYSKLPPCASASSPLLCADPAVVAKLQQADECAYGILVVAEILVRRLPVPPPAIACGDPKIVSALLAASNSVPQLVVVAQQAVTSFAAITSTLRR
jgi:hypothetical protein